MWVGGKSTDTMILDAKADYNFYQGGCVGVGDRREQKRGFPERPFLLVGARRNCNSGACLPKSDGVRRFLSVEGVSLHRNVRSFVEKNRVFCRKKKSNGGTGTA